MDNFIDLLVNPNKIQNHIPNTNNNNNNKNIEEYKKNIINHINNYNINFNKKLNINDILDLLFFIEYHNKYNSVLCNDCKKKINDLK